MTTYRRTLLKGIAAAAASMTVISTPALARSRKTAPSDAVGLLYDATKCVGCKACVVACKESAGLPADTRASKLYDAPEGLNEFTKNVIQLAKEYLEACTTSKGGVVYQYYGSERGDHTLLNARATPARTGFSNPNAGSSLKVSGRPPVTS